MNRDDGAAPNRVERLDIVEFGGPHGSGWSTRRWSRWLPLALAAGAVAAFVVQAEQARSPSASPTPHPYASAGLSRTPGSAAAGVGSPAPRIIEVGRPLLGVTARWELFGRGPTGVVRIELARGRVTHTAVPALGSTGPVFFVVGRDWAMVRPLDLVAGYVVPDGGPAQTLNGALSQGGPVLPGPDQATVWVRAAQGDQAAMTLVGIDGRATGVSIAIRPGLNGRTDPDGTGYLVLTGPGGAYRARPDGLRRVTTGALLAVGPTRWLTLECDDHYHCASVVIDRRTGTRRILDSRAVPTNHSPGLISPSGSAAALLVTDSDAATTVHLLDLASATDRRLDVAIDRFLDATMVWSPDGRWLFIAGAGGSLYAVDAATARVHDLGVALPPVTQLAVRDNGPLVSRALNWIPKRDMGVPRW